MRVAIVHDWLPLFGGAERVLEQILAVFPDADLFSIVDWIPRSERGFLRNKSVRTSFIQQLPWAREHYRAYLPLMPLAIEQFDLSKYELILSSSYAVAKGVLTAPEQLHICYCHSPIRYAWDLQEQYLRASGLVKGVSTWLARALLHYIRMWDLRTANGVDHFVANSHFVARRIRKVYGRDAAVIHPPVDTEHFQPAGTPGNYYFTASRFVPYKRVDLLVDAFARMPDRELIVAGDGPGFEQLKARAPRNVKLVGAQPQDELIRLMQHARAFVFAAKEDFGIAAVEAQACGTPVIAFGQGGLAETVLHGKTGVLFPEQTAESVVKAVQDFERLKFCPDDIRLNAQRFSGERFRREFAAFVEAKWLRHEHQGVDAAEGISLEAPIGQMAIKPAVRVLEPTFP